MKILKFYAPWCAPCKTLSKMMEQNLIDHESVNIEEDVEGISEKYNVKGLPTLVFIDESGNEAGRLTGGNIKVDQIKAFVS